MAQALRPAVVNLSGGKRGEGSGSGILFTPDGFLLTNHHVVQGIRRIHVRLNDGRDLGGRVVGTDPWTDLAVVQAEGGHLPFAAFGDSTRLRVGQLVLAIGSPLHQEKILTTGIVSKVNASILISDVNINHGNSGGPLLNLAGEAIAD